MKRGIGVIMDVVYNHTYSSYSSPFQWQYQIIITVCMKMVHYKMGQDVGTKWPVRKKCTASI